MPLGVVVVEIVQRLKRDLRAIRVEIASSWPCGEEARILDIGKELTRRHDRDALPFHDVADDLRHRAPIGTGVQGIRGIQRTDGSDVASVSLGMKPSQEIVTFAWQL